MGVKAQKFSKMLRKGELFESVKFHKLLVNFFKVNRVSNNIYLNFLLRNQDDINGLIVFGVVAFNFINIGLIFLIGLVFLEMNFLYLELIEESTYSLLAFQLKVLIVFVYFRDSLHNDKLI